MTVVGVDGCKAGWLAVKLNKGGAWAIDVIPDAAGLWRRFSNADLILIDIPIGLPDSSRPARACDKEARRILGRARRSSVFPVPCRAALEANTYTLAGDRNEREIGKRLSLQSYQIRPKIGQVDTLLRQDAKASQIIREVHPEICFWAFNGRRATNHGKKSKLGILERRRVLERVFPASQEIISSALDQFPRKDVGRDDILDALVAAVTALEPVRLTSIPAAEETDVCGLRMEMVYRLPGG